MKRLTPYVIVVLLLAAVPAVAGTTPSKTAPDQTIEARQADLARVNDVLAVDGVSTALEAQGFSRDEVASRVAALSDEELSSLADNLDQIQAAGLTREQWTWIAVGALAVIILIAVL